MTVRILPRSVATLLALGAFAAVVQQTHAQTLVESSAEARFPVQRQREGIELGQHRVAQSGSTGAVEGAFATLSTSLS